MDNISIKMNGTKLIIEIDTSPAAVKAAKLSSTGKTRLLASTRGPIVIEGKLDGLKVTLNATIPV